MHPACTSQASVSRVKTPFALGSASAGGCTSTVLGAFDAINWVMSSRGNCAGCSFCNPLFSGTTILAKFGTYCQNMR